MTATLVLDSVSPSGARLTTFELTMSVACLGQITKHRALSINAESARAVPTKVAMAQVRDNPWVPRTWPQNGPGMVPGGMVPENLQAGVEAMWRQAARSAVRSAGDLVEMGCHKEIANRLLAPFRRIKVVVSGTGDAWPNFYSLRCAPDAQEEIRTLAVAMLEAQMLSDCGGFLETRTFHLPYVSRSEWLATGEGSDEAATRTLMLASAYRCARVSFGRVGASGLSLEEESARGRKLANDRHWSALEHVATAIDSGDPTAHHLDARVRSGNYTGWDQFRKELGG